MAVQCILVGKGKDDVFTAVYGETTFDKVLKAYNENKVIQVIYQNRIYYLDNTTVVDSPEAFSFISAFSNQNDETGEIKHYVISLMTGDSWSGPFLQKSTPTTHANTHSKNGDDPLTPADIGAMELSENVLKQSNEDITSQVARALSGDLVPFSGGTMTGLLNVLAPVGDSNATTKKYVDDALSEKIGMDGIGDLHVWRKTVVTSDPIPEVPASYNIGSAMSLLFATPTDTSNAGYVQNLNVSESISVDQYGTVSLVSPSTVNFVIGYSSSTFDVNDSAVLGSNKRYFMVGSNTWGNRATVNNELLNVVYYVAPNTTFTQGNKDNKTPGYFNAAQKVTGIPFTPAIPAGTTTTYPVSTNPNAYQEGEYGKAGYTLGDVKTGTFQIGQGATTVAANRAIIKYGASISVTDTGTASIASESEKTVTSDTNQASVDGLKGKFFHFSQLPFSSSAFSVGKFYFFPANTVFTKQSSGNWYASKYQTVTSHGKTEPEYTIEYLGKLGDKVRVQVMSYVGTGTSGIDHKNSLTFDFAPKLIIISSIYNKGYSHVAIIIPGIKNGVALAAYQNGQSRTGYSIISGIIDKTVNWYSDSYVDAQMNTSGTKYMAIAIG